MGYVIETFNELGERSMDAMSLDDFLAEESKPAYTLEPVPGDDNILKVTPWVANGGCNCQHAFEVPKQAIRSVKPTGETHPCCGKILRVVEVDFGDAKVDIAEVFRQLAAPAAREPERRTPPSMPARRAVEAQSICVCDHFIRRFCQGNQLYEEYWCYDETGAFCGTQVVPLGLSCTNLTGAGQYPLARPADGPQRLASPVGGSVEPAPCRVPYPQAGSTYTARVVAMGAPPDLRRGGAAMQAAPGADEPVMIRRTLDDCSHAYYGCGSCWAGPPYCRVVVNCPDHYYEYCDRCC
jgi:hypothetical protein